MYIQCDGEREQYNALTTLQNSHITSLHKELRDVRQAYLSTAQPRKGLSRSAPGQSRIMTDREREEVDANAKQMIRELNASIRAMDDAETLRRETEHAIVQKRYGSALGALGSWASGGSATSKSQEHQEAEARAQQTAIHRDGVMWFLRQRLESCCRTQQDMMETRLERELEKAKGFNMPSAAEFEKFVLPSEQAHNSSAAGEENGPTAGQGLTPEQMQMFEEGNQDMMKYYESTLDKVRYVTAAGASHGLSC